MLNKRRKMNNRLRVRDRDYMSYLEIKYHSHRRGPRDSDDDPQYVLFLKRTKRKGKSYVTTFEETGVLMFVHYESDRSCRKVKKVGNGECDMSRFKIEEKMARTEDGDYMRYLEIKNGSPQEGGSESGDSTYCNNANDNVYDPQYVMFLSNTKQSGLSYVTTLEENGLRLSIHYEKEGFFGIEGNDNVSEGNEEDVNQNLERLNLVRSGMGTFKEPKIEQEDITFEPFTPPSMYNMKNNSNKSSPAWRENM